jgi:hypothetical protein
MTNLLVAVFAVALASVLLLKPGGRRTFAFLTTLIGLIISLVAQSPTRPVGDTREYVLMSINLARLERPSVTTAQLSQIPALFPGATADDMVMPELTGPDGRQDFPHFWFYSLLAAPFVGVAQLVGAHAVSGFTVLNLLLLVGAALLVLERTTPAVALFIVAGPILWWVDKAHAEVLTFSMIVVGLTMLPSRPWWSIAAFGIASVQSPAAAGAAVIAIGCAFFTRGWRDRRIWAASLAAVVGAALHPLYFYSRLRVWSGLYEGVDRHWPSWRELMVVPFDSNVGIFVNQPLLLLAMIVALAEAITRPPRAVVERTGGMTENVTFGVIALFFLVSFTQTTNFNSGGTPSPSRYGLWLVPFAIHILARIPERARWIRLLAAGSVMWCVWSFAPVRPDQYLQPTPFAAALWQRRPQLDNPLAEIFAERAAGREPARPPVASAGCEKILLWGDGSGAAWPPRCTSTTVPAFCRVKDALCYANRVGGGYQFVQAPSPPAWRIEITRDNRPRWSGGMLGIAQSAEPRIPMAIWHDDGWSYPERLSEPSPDVVAREWRWMADRAAVSVMSSETVSARLKIIARALAKPRRMRVSIGDFEVDTLLVSPDRAEHQTDRFTLPAGTSVISLESLDGSDSPGTGDPRTLSFAVYRLELTASRP